MKFEEWLEQQPFGGSSKTPGKRLLTDSTVNLMRKSWEASRYHMMKELADLPFSPEQEVTPRMRGDIVELY